MEEKIINDFNNNGLTPYDISIKYNMLIDEVYIVLKKIKRKVLDEH